MDPYPTDCFFSPTLRSTCTGIKFSPKLSMQRYITVLQVIKDFYKRNAIDQVTEFGCGSYVFLDNYVTTCDFITRVNQIDINRERLLGALHMIEMNQFHKLNKSKREPLKVNIFHGNVANKDHRIQNSDVVVAIELIEHLFEKDFHSFPATIFEFIKPKLVVITTPNYDFNVLFDNGGKFRDEDHKFELTKMQFTQWGNDITSKYREYNVKFFGIGEAPDGCSKEIGHCTQMAIFEQKNLCDISAINERVQNYDLIGSYVYFRQVDDTTDEEKLWNQINNLIINYIVDEEDLLYVDNNKCELGGRYICLPLNLVTENCKKKNTNINEKDIVFIMSTFGNVYPMKEFDNYGILLIVTDECAQYCDNQCSNS